MSGDLVALAITYVILIPLIYVAAHYGLAAARRWSDQDSSHD